MRVRAVLATVLLISAASNAQSTVTVGPLTLSVHESQTAQLFHIVDQLADWDARTHRSYVRWADDSLGLDSADRMLLARHGKLRHARGWAHGFEAAFYTDDDIPRAAGRAVERMLLTKREAREEEEILAHFALRLGPMLDAAAPRVHAMAARMVSARDSLDTVLAPLLQITVGKRPKHVEVFLAPNPISGSRGGRFVDGRVIVEVPARPDAMASLYHELFHALSVPYIATMRRVASRAGLDLDELDEALAYAFSPGLTTVGSDALARLYETTSVASPGRRTWHAALLIRPLLSEALQRGESLASFLARTETMLRKSAPL